MWILFDKLDGSLDALLFEQLMEVIQKRRVMFVEQLFSFQILVRRHHDVIEIAVSDLQIVEIANVSFGGDLGPNWDIGNCSQFALFHEAELLGMVIAPFEGPALLLFELKHTSSLRVDLQNVQNTSYVDKSQPSAVRIDTDYQRKRFPE